MVKLVLISQALLVAEYLSFSRAAQVLGFLQSAGGCGSRRTSSAFPCSSAKRVASG